MEHIGRDQQADITRRSNRFGTVNRFGLIALVHSVSFNRFGLIAFIILFDRFGTLIALRISFNRFGTLIALHIWFNRFGLIALVHINRFGTYRTN